jgi:hypothetical protein
MANLTVYRVYKWLRRMLYVIQVLLTVRQEHMDLGQCIVDRLSEGESKWTPRQKEGGG